MRLRGLTILAAAWPMLSGCFESEQTCYDRLLDDLDDSYATTERMLKDPNTISSDSQINDLQISILSEKVRLGQLYYSTSVNVCDFHLDGITLVKN